MLKLRNLLPILLLLGMLSGCGSDKTMTVLDLTNEEITEVQGESPLRSAAPQMTIYLYTTNGIISDSTQELTPEWLVSKLAQQLVFPETVKVLSFSNENNKLNVDFNQALGDHIQGLGSYGEGITIHCIVNTFLDAYDAESLTFTVEGQPLNTGNGIYDYPQTYMRNYLD